MAEYAKRQEAFRIGEIAALKDTASFAARAQALYGYPHFICDTGGSICEWVDAEDPADPILSALSQQALMIWVRGTEAHTEELIRRFDRAPKPMAYQPEFLANAWASYLAEKGVCEAQVDPDSFIRWTYARALAHRQPRYESMAANWGITIDASDLGAVSDEASFVDLVARALDHR